MQYILERLREGGSYAGIFMFAAGVFGLEFSQDMMDQLKELGTAIAGFLLMVLPEKMGEKK